MVIFPRAGRQYWLVIDIWETFCVVPVTVASRFTVWDLGEGQHETYPLSWRNLYRKQARAERTAAKQNKSITLMKLKGLS